MNKMKHYRLFKSLKEKEEIHLELIILTFETINTFYVYKNSKS